MQGKRLDIFITEKGLVESRSLAQRIIMAGEVRVNGEIIDQASKKVNLNDEIIINQRPQFVSRGGEKLQSALINFKLENLNGKICADVGSSTGGFTDCLLQNNAKKVYSIDVGYGLIHWKLRNDPRIVLMEKTNARFIVKLPETIDLVTIDASFISLKKLIPVVQKWLKDSGEIIALVKPQFEAGREISAKGKGVIREPQIHREVLNNIILFAQAKGFYIKGVISSHLLGPKGNREFFLYLGLSNTIDSNQSIDINKLLSKIEGL